MDEALQGASRRDSCSCKTVRQKARRIPLRVPAAKKLRFVNDSGNWDAGFGLIGARGPLASRSNQVAVALSKDRIRVNKTREGMANSLKMVKHAKNHWKEARLARHRLYSRKLARVDVVARAMPANMARSQLCFAPWFSQWWNW